MKNEAKSYYRESNSIFKEGWFYNFWCVKFARVRECVRVRETFFVDSMLEIKGEFSGIEKKSYLKQEAI